MSPVFKNDGERSTAKNYHPFSLLSFVGKVLEKLVHNRIVDHLEKHDLFSDFPNGFRYFQSTADLLTLLTTYTFPTNTLMTLVMMLSVILLSLLMIPLSILSVIRYLICGNNFSWLLNLNLICETL